jgi:hypothetical protein
MRVHILYASGNGTLCHNGIGIKEQHIPALYLIESHVVGFTESGIEVIGYNLYLREPVTQKLHRTIIGVIVNHQYLRIRNGAQHGVKALLNVIPYFIADYDDAY